MPHINIPDDCIRNANNNNNHYYLLLYRPKLGDKLQSLI